MEKCRCVLLKSTIKGQFSTFLKISKIKFTENMEQKSKIEMRNGRIHVRIDEDDTIQTGNESKESMLASLQEAKYSNSGPFGFFVALGSIICGSCDYFYLLNLFFF